MFDVLDRPSPESSICVHKTVGTIRQFPDKHVPAWEVEKIGKECGRVLGMCEGEPETQ